MTSNLIKVISKSKRANFEPGYKDERKIKGTEGRTLPRWQPSIFSTDGAYILAQIDYLTNFTGVFDGMEYSMKEEYDYFLSEEDEGFCEYFRYRFPAAQGTIVIQEPKERGDIKKTYQYVNASDLPGKKYDILLSRLPTSYKAHIMSTPPEDLSQIALYLLLAIQTHISKESIFLLPTVPESILGTSIINLLDQVYETIYIIQPTFATTPWVYATDYREQFNHQQLEKIIDELIGKNTLGKSFSSVHKSPPYQEETDQIALTIDWKLPGPIDQRYQTACPIMTRIRQR